MVDTVPALAVIGTPSLDELASAIADAVRHRLGGGDLDVDVLVVDHAWASLHPLAGSGDGGIELDVELLGALTGSEPHTVGDQTYVPFRAHDEPVGLVRIATGTAGPIGGLLGDLGQLVRSRMRFDDELAGAVRRQHMSTAAQLQWETLTTKAVEVGPLRAGAALEPAYDCAGDLFELARTGPDSLGVAVLDGMGHGGGAALSGALTLSALRSARRDGANLADQVSAADEAVLSQWGGDRFVTLTVVEVAPQGLRVVNAGHEPVTRIGPAGAQTLDVPADRPVGVARTKSYTVHEIDPLERGERLVLHSDGVTGAQGSGEGAFGPGGLRAVVDAVDGPPLLAAHLVARAVMSYVGRDLDDDATVVVVDGCGGDG